MTTPILSIENLAVIFKQPSGDVYAVRDVSFELHKGEILGIVGESGSGKTVTCRSILQLLPNNAQITSGHIYLDGNKDLLTLTSVELSKLRGERISMIFQSPSTYLDPLMTSGHQIGEGLQFHGNMNPRESRQQSIQLLKTVRIREPEQRVNSYPHELSGGMKQRVMIASALACQPHILLADEPTTGLDVTVQAGILKLLKQLRKEQEISIIVVSHDLGVIAEICDRVVVMKDGNVVETGPTRQILLQPQAEYTKTLISAHPSRFLNIHEHAPHEDNVGEALEQPVLQIESLSVIFGYTGLLFHHLPEVLVKPLVQAVEDVTFDIKRGEAVGIVGESGSGKSTVARTIVRLIKPTKGKILYKGEDVHLMGTRNLLAYRRSIQLIFQDPFSSLNPRMTIYDTLAEPLRKHHICPDNEVDSQISELLASVDLSLSLKNRKPHEISGGQCQRVAIARALTLKPEIIIADEITSALDVTIQAQILELLEKLRVDMNLTILMISHDLGVVKRICERILVMHNGHVVESGAANQVILHPKDPYTKELVAAVPRMPTQ